MTCTALLLNVLVLVVTLTDHCVLTTSASRPFHYDKVGLYAYFRGTAPLSISGFSYSSGLIDQVHFPCCLVFVQGNQLCDSLPPPPTTGCSCTVYYHVEVCTNGLLVFAKRVQDGKGSAAVFATNSVTDELTSIADRESLNIPIILVDNNDGRSHRFVASLSGGDPQVKINVTGRQQIPPDGGDKGLRGGRSATTFYFVVFAFTILLLLSLTWFVFNYLRRCHHLYTVKRQRAEMLSKTRKAIEKCPTKTYKKSKKPSQKTVSKDDTDSVASDEDERCPICLETFKVKDTLRVLPCHHEFHKSCIDPWLYDKGTCPMCKLSIVGDHEECDSNEASGVTSTPQVMELENMEEGLSNSNTSRPNTTNR